MELDKDPLFVTHGNSISRIVLHDAKRHNVINSRMILELEQAIDTAVSNKKSRAIVISSVGDHFCQGLDLESLLSQTETERFAMFASFQSLLLQIQKCPIPVIASVDGKASGGALGLIAACDMVIATSKTTFMLPEAISGMIPAIITPFLLRRMLPARLQALALSTRGIEAAEAHAWGLVDELAAGDLNKATDAQCQRILRSYPGALAHIKHSIHQCESEGFEQQNISALNHLNLWLRNPEVMDGIKSFSDGFSPEWFQKLKKES